MKRAGVAALLLLLVACGGGAPATTATVAAPVATASPPSDVRLSIDRSVVSASPITPGDPPTVTVHLSAPAGASGRHVTLVIDGAPTTFGVDVAAGQTDATFHPPPAALSKGAVGIAVEGQAAGAVKLQVVRPAIRLECPSTVDASKPFDLPVVLDAPAPPDGYRVSILARYSYGPTGRGGGGQHIELTFSAGLERDKAVVHAPDAPLLEVTVVDALDAHEVRAKCQISVRGASPPPSTKGGLI